MEDTSSILVAGNNKQIVVRMVDAKGVAVPMTEKEADAIVLRIQHDHAVFHPPGTKVQSRSSSGTHHSFVRDEQGQACPYGSVEFDVVITNVGSFQLHVDSDGAMTNQLPPFHFHPAKHAIRVVPSVPDPNHCIIGGPGIESYPFSRHHVTFCTIVACDRFGNAIREGGCRFDVVVSGRGVRVAKTIDYNNGVYEMWYGVGSGLLREDVTDITVSILLRGCPLSQSPLSPVGSSLPSAQFQLPDGNGGDDGGSDPAAGVVCLMSNTSNGVLVSRSLRALASFSMLDIQAVAGEDDAPKVFAAAWAKVVERGQNRRLSILNGTYSSPAKKQNKNGATTSLQDRQQHHSNSNSDPPTLVEVSYSNSWLNAEDSLSLSELVQQSLSPHLRSSTPILDLSNTHNTEQKRTTTIPVRSLTTFGDPSTALVVKRHKNDNHNNADRSKVLRRKAYDEMLRRRRRKNQMKRGQEAIEAEEASAVERLLVVQRQLEQRHAMLIGEQQL